MLCDAAVNGNVREHIEFGRRSNVTSKLHDSDQENHESEAKVYCCDEKNEISPRLFKRKPAMENRRSRLLSKIGKVVRNVKLESIPTLLFSAFNSGDMQCLQDIIESITSESVCLKTRCLDSPIYGRNHVVKFFEAFIDGHPDAYIISNDVKFVDECTMQAAVDFKGTKALPSEKEHYFIRPRLVDNMDLTKLSPQHIELLRQLENYLIVNRKPIEVEFTGYFTLVFDGILPTCPSTPASPQVHDYGRYTNNSLDEYSTNSSGSSVEDNVREQPDTNHRRLPKSPLNSTSFSNLSMNSTNNCKCRISEMIFSYHLLSFREALIIPPTPDSP
jgi:hypothetical protein